MESPTPRLTGQWADPLWRVSHIYLIKDKLGRRSRLDFNRIQLRITDPVRDRIRLGLPIRHFDLKYRQGGVSTFWDIFLLDQTIFRPNTSTCILANLQKSLDHLWGIVRFAYDTMPERLKPPVVRDTLRTLHFKGLESRIFVDLKVQSTTLQNLHISEFPLCDPDVVRQTIGACTPDANIIYEGVAEGMNHAYDFWGASGDGFTRMFHPWFIQEEYRSEPQAGMVWTAEEDRLAKMALRDYGVRMDDAQMQYRREQKALLGPLYYQERAEDPITCFLSTGNPFFDGAKVKSTMAKAAMTPPIRQETPRQDNAGRIWHELEVWAEPKVGHRYVAGADVAEGYEPKQGDRDYSVLGIIDLNTRKTVLRLKARLKPDAFARECARWCSAYNNAFLGVERNSVGMAVLELLLHVEKYSNLYGENVSDRRVRVITPGTKSLQSKEEVRYGWRTDASSKTPLLIKFRQAIEGDSLEGPEDFTPAFEMLDLELLREALNVRDDAGKVKAASGYHDDLVMAWAIAYEMFALKGGGEPPKSEPAPGGGPVGTRSEAARLFDDLNQRGESRSGGPF